MLFANSKMMKNVDEIDFVPEREICAAKKNNDSNHFIAYKVLPTMSQTFQTLVEIFIKYAIRKPDVENTKRRRSQWRCRPTMGVRTLARGTAVVH